MPVLQSKSEVLDGGESWDDEAVSFIESIEEVILNVWFIFGIKAIFLLLFEESGLPLMCLENMLVGVACGFSL